MVLSDQLTSSEFRLLKFFLENQNKVLGREEIINAVWKDTKSQEGVTDQALDQLIFRLRKKIEDELFALEVGERYLAAAVAGQPEIRCGVACGQFCGHVPSFRRFRAVIVDPRLALGPTFGRSTGGHANLTFSRRITFIG